MWIHVIALCAAHDAKLCRKCDAIVMQIAWHMKNEKRIFGGDGGAAPPDNQIDELEELPF